MMDNKFMDLDEFATGGYLQEANRLFFHPLGLALAIVEEDDGTKRLEVLDWRNDDDIGGYFADGVISKEKADKVQREWLKRANSRFKKLGYLTQPVGK